MVKANLTVPPFGRNKEWEGGLERGIHRHLQVRARPKGGLKRGSCYGKDEVMDIIKKRVIESMGLDSVLMHSTVNVSSFCDVLGVVLRAGLIGKQGKV